MSVFGALWKMKLANNSRNLDLIECIKDRKLTIEIAKNIVSKSPSCLDGYDEYGYSPIHLVNHMQYYHSDEILKFLVSQQPNTLRMKSLQGDLPIHMALCNENVKPETILYMISLFPDSVKAIGEHGCLPLHYACRWSKDVSIVKKLVDLYPEAVKVYSRKYGLPVHMAFLNDHMTSETISYLLEVYPNSIHQKDSTKRLPLHLACRLNKYASLAVNLIDKYEDGLEVVGGINDDIPLTFAMSNSIDSELIIHMVSLRPKTLLYKTKGSSTAFHIACKNKFKYGDILPVLCDLCPDGLLTVNNSQEMFLPIHIACAYGLLCEKTIIYLASKCPQTLLSEEMPLMMIVSRSADPASLNIIRAMVKLCPESIFKRNIWRSYGSKYNIYVLDTAFQRATPGVVNNQHTAYRILLNFCPAKLPANHINSFRKFNMDARAPVLLLASKLSKSNL